MALINPTLSAKKQMGPLAGPFGFFLPSMFLVTDIGNMLNHRSAASTDSLALKPPSATVSRFT